jgi:hypothetical protein
LTGVTHRWIAGLLAVGTVMVAFMIYTVGGSSRFEAQGTRPMPQQPPEGPSEIELEQRAELARAIQEQTAAETNLQAAATNAASVKTTTKP